MLIAVDDPAITAPLRDYFAGKRYEVLSVESTSGVLATVRTRRPHVVLLDVHMAGAVDGGALIAAISTTAPVIVVTAEPDVEIARRALQDGAFDFVKTPFDLPRVRQLIDTAVQHAPDLL